MTNFNKGRSTYSGYKDDGFCDAHHPVIAAIDLGTNSCRLIIASVNIATLKKSFFRSRPQSKGWKILDSFARIVRLGEGLYKEDVLSADAIERTIEALKICKRKMDFHNVKHLRAVATEACRRASNSQELVDRVNGELGINLEVVSTEEEARLALTGCAGIMSSSIPYGIVFDIGGGSTEVIFVRIDQTGRQRPGYPVAFEVIDSISLPHGVVTLSEKYAQFASSPEIHQSVRDLIKNSLMEFVIRNEILQHIDKNDLQTVGSSGTVTTFAALHLGLQKYERKKIDGLFLTTDDINTISYNLLNMPYEERMNHPCIATGRSDLVIVGSAILQGMCDALPHLKIRVADRGVREGILAEMLQKV